MRHRPRSAGFNQLASKCDSWKSEPSDFGFVPDIPEKHSSNGALNLDPKDYFCCVLPTELFAPRSRIFRLCELNLKSR
jgi:hypothetical protein